MKTFRLVPVYWMSLGALGLLALQSPVAGQTTSAKTTSSEKPNPNPPPKGKQTTLGLYLTARQAHEKWKANPAKVKILDVRTPEEFLFVGHAEMAWNIPFGFLSYESQGGVSQFGMKPNPDFVAQVKGLAKPDETLFIMCRSGGRSAQAVNVLAKAGFKNVYNIVDGMEGDTVEDPDSVFDGKRMKNGWKNAGLPWTFSFTP
jgi:rhodanese-related sulfurtransferase